MTEYQYEQLELRKMQIKYSGMEYTLPDTYQEKNDAYTKAFHAGKDFRVGYDTFIYRTHGLAGTIKIGDNVVISDHCIIDYSGDLEIGNNVKIAARTLVYSHKHPNFQILNNDNKEGSAIKAKTVIGNDVVIEAGCIIYPGIKLGDHAVIYAGSVVMDDVEPFGIVAGNPAKDIREIFIERRKAKKKKTSSEDER